MKHLSHRTGRISGTSARRIAKLCACCVLAAVLLATAAAAETAGQTWEERLAEARTRYNEETVNVFRYGKGKIRKEKINAYFYPTDDKKNLNIKIRESLQITDEAEMEAILEVITRNEYYQEDEYGTISFMKAQWIAHNMAHAMATGTKEEQQAVVALAGEKLRDVLSRSKFLDISPYSYLTEEQISMYEIIETLFVLNGQ